MEGLVGWDLKDHPVQVPCHEQECLPLEQVALWTSKSISFSSTGSNHSLEEEFSPIQDLCSLTEEYKLQHCSS